MVVIDQMLQTFENLLQYVANLDLQLVPPLEIQEIFKYGMREKMVEN